jgi:MSHA biogenesis protein MshJ
MKQLLQKYADGIDAMALRERAMFFGAVALVLMTLLQVFLLNPVLSRRNQLSAQIAQQEDETKAIQAQIQSLIRPNAPDRDALNREKLKSLREQMAQLDRQFEEQQKQFVAPEKMAAMLEAMIGKNRKLQLLSLRNLPGTALSAGAQAPIGAAGERPRPGGAREVLRHTVELSVKGSYFDLLDYLASLERMPQRVFWDGFELSVAQYPQSVLKLTVYTLSPEKSWLTV